jgi:1,4-dihydroxy-2-naphthoate octaprenyltransferase
MASTTFPIRTFLQRLLGPELLAYLLHLRPMEWPIMTAHFLLGTFMACGFHASWRATLLGWFVFVALLNGGTLAINSAYDQDEGDVGYLRQPPKPPKYLLHVSVAMLAASLGLGFLLPRVFAWSNAACVVMAVLYSAPPVRLKARAGWDLIINCIGFGMLTPLAGWGLTGRPLTPAFLWVAAGFALLFGALYPMTQIYQIEEDRGRGDRTLVIQMGESLSLILALVMALGAHGCFLAGLLKEGRPLPLLAVSWLGWMMVILPWLARWKHWTARQHEAGMYRGLAAWAVTDVVLLILLWPR